MPIYIKVMVEVGAIRKPVLTIRMGSFSSSPVTGPALLVTAPGARLLPISSM
ncbi:hypothetical protein [Streptomyces sp. NPDC054901]